MAEKANSFWEAFDPTKPLLLYDAFLAGQGVTDSLDQRTKEQHWRQHLAAWRRSELTVRACCRAEGLSEPSFYAWRRTLSERRRRTTPADRATWNS